MKVSHLTQTAPHLNSPPHGRMQLTTKTSITLNSPLTPSCFGYWLVPAGS